MYFEQSYVAQPEFTDKMTPAMVIFFVRKSANTGSWKDSSSTAEVREARMAGIVVLIIFVFFVFDYNLQFLTV